MSSAVGSARRRGARGVLAGASVVVALCLSGPPLHAQDDAAAPPPEVTTTRPTSGALEPGDLVPADLVVANRRIFTLRAENEFGTPPAGRLLGIDDRLRAVIDRGGPLAITTTERDGYVAILVDGNLLFRVLPGDVDPEVAQTPREVASEAVRHLRPALADLSEARDSHALARAAGKTALATLLLAAALWLIVTAQAWVSRRVAAFVKRRSETLVPAWGQQLVHRGRLAELLALPTKLLAWGLAALFVYEWAVQVLRLFPYTRPWGETLGANLAESLGAVGKAVLHAVPNLLCVIAIFVVTRFVARVVRSFFDGVQARRIEVGWIDDATARPTGRLIIAILWLFAFVAAYPYIPGSDSEAFKGIGVFVGLMMSIGASGVVNQAVSGLMLMYTRALRPGDFVQIGDNEGTVTAVGFLTTRIETLRNVEVNIPNAVIAGNVTRNFSRLAAQGGVRLSTSVTIGYDTPWRQVQAMLRIAAARTQGLAPQPPPRVLQTSLQDFYVEYTLVVTIADPREKLTVLDELHGHVQDVFNEHGVQIMSPNYEADPDTPKVVPREQWYAAPAVAPAQGPAARPAPSAATTST